MINKRFSVVILAAGFSKRMGMPKFSMPFDRNSTFLEHLLQQYSDFGAHKIQLVIQQNELDLIATRLSQKFERFNICTNPFPEKGRFFSLKTALKTLSTNLPVLIHNIDNPFVDKDVVGKLLEYVPEYDYILPEYQERGGHPFCISTDLSEKIRSIDNDEQHLKEYLRSFRHIRIAVASPNVLVNINTPDDYRQYFPLNEVF